MNRLLLSVTTIASIAACSPKSPPEGAAAPEPAPLVGTEWRLRELNNDPAPDGAGGRPATLTMDTARRVTGFGGCNRFSGSYLVNGDSLRFAQLAMTRMACSQGTELEVAFTWLLETVRSYRIAGGYLDLIAGDSVVARLEGAGKAR